MSDEACARFLDGQSRSSSMDSPDEHSRRILCCRIDGIFNIYRNS